jgi:hypothetical protein
MPPAPLTTHNTCEGDPGSGSGSLWERFNERTLEDSKFWDRGSGEAKHSSGRDPREKSNIRKRTKLSSHSQEPSSKRLRVRVVIISKTSLSSTKNNRITTTSHLKY